MPGPSVKTYFSNESEYHTILKIAAQHDMTLPQYVHACVIRTTNEVLAERAKAQQPEQPPEVEVSNDTEDKEVEPQS